MRCAIYVRVSTADQNTDMQLNELQDFASARGFIVRRVFEDRSTGTTTNRHAFKELLTFARSRQVDAILVWKLDRFARSLKDLLTTLQELDEIGIQFISLKDSLDFTTSQGRLLTQILGSFAEFEASIIRERVRAGIASAKRKGKRLGRPPRIDREAVVTLRGTGRSLSGIAAELNTTKSAVSKILAKRALQVSESSSV